MEYFESISQLLGGGYRPLLFYTCAILIGMSKTGIHGVGTLSVPALAFLFGAKTSTGVLLPILCIADLMAVLYYRRELQLKNISKLLSWTVVGLGIALAVGNQIHPSGFRVLMGICIFLGLAILVWSERKKDIEVVTQSKFYAPLFGLMVGFATMIGNAAGPIVTVYLLSMRLNKIAFVSTGAWFIMSVNFIKMPLQIWIWDNLDLPTLLLGLTTVPFIAIGALLGIRLVKILPEKEFRQSMIVLTVIATLFLFF